MLVSWHKVDKWGYFQIKSKPSYAENNSLCVLLVSLSHHSKTEIFLWFLKHCKSMWVKFFILSSDLA